MVPFLTVGTDVGVGLVGGMEQVNGRDVGFTGGGWLAVLECSKRHSKR